MALNSVHGYKEYNGDNDPFEFHTGKIGMGGGKPVPRRIWAYREKTMDDLYLEAADDPQNMLAALAEEGWEATENYRTFMNQMLTRNLRSDPELLDDLECPFWVVNALRVIQAQRFLTLCFYNYFDTPPVPGWEMLTLERSGANADGSLYGFEATWDMRDMKGWIGLSRDRDKDRKHYAPRRRYKTTRYRIVEPEEDIARTEYYDTIRDGWNPDSDKTGMRLIQTDQKETEGSHRHIIFWENKGG